MSKVLLPLSIPGAEGLEPSGLVPWSSRKVTTTRDEPSARPETERAPSGDVQKPAISHGETDRDSGAQASCQEC